MQPLAPRSLLAHHGAHPMVLDLYCLKLLGAEYYLWEPETIWTELLRESGAPNISEVNKNKIQAVRTVHHTDAVFQRWEVFEKIIAAFNNLVPRFDVMQRPTLGQLVAGVDIIQQLRGGSFEDEVSRYVAASLLTEGVQYAPEPIEFSNEHLASMSPVHATVATAWRAGKTSDPDETVDLQLRRLQDAKNYRLQFVERLRVQLGVMNESGHAPSV